MKRPSIRWISPIKECLSKIASHEVNFALYHQMVGQNDEEHFRQIPAEYFDLIIVR